MAVPASQQTNEAHKQWAAANEKYDYHVAGVAGALTAWAVQTLDVTSRAWPAGLQLAGIVALVLAVWAALARIQRAVHIQSLSLQQAKTVDHLNQAHQRALEAHAIGEQPDLERLTRTEGANESIKGHIQKARKRALWAYKARNWLLLTGLTIYSAGRVWAKLNALG